VCGGFPFAPYAGLCRDSMVAVLFGGGRCGCGYGAANKRVAESWQGGRVPSQADRERCSDDIEDQGAAEAYGVCREGIDKSIFGSRLPLLTAGTHGA